MTKATHFPRRERPGEWVSGAHRKSGQTLWQPFPHPPPERGIEELSLGNQQPTCRVPGSGWWVTPIHPASPSLSTVLTSHPGLAQGFQTSSMSPCAQPGTGRIILNLQALACYWTRLMDAEHPASPTHSGGGSTQNECL